MTEVVLCAVCGAEQRTDIGVACTPCAGRYRSRITGVPDLLACLQDTAARLDRVESDSTGNDDERRTLDHRYPLTAAATAVPYDGRAAEAHAHLVDVLARHADHAWQALTRPCGHPSCSLAPWPQPGPVCPTEARRRAHRAAAHRDPARYLADHARDLRHHDTFPTMHDELGDAVTHGWRLVDRPAERRELGICAAPLDQAGQPGETCPVHLYARVQDATVTCPGCGTPHDVAARQDTLGKTADDILLTATQAARALTRLDRPVTDSAIRGWRRLGHITPIDVNEHGQPLYRFGDVRDIEKKIRYGVTPGRTA